MGLFAAKPVTIGVMALAMPPAQAAVLVLVPAFVTNIWQMMSGRNFIVIVKRLWTLQVSICIGAVRQSYSAKAKLVR